MVLVEVEDGVPGSYRSRGVGGSLPSSSKADRWSGVLSENGDISRSLHSVDSLLDESSSSFWRVSSSSSILRKESRLLGISGGDMVGGRAVRGVVVEEGGA